MAKQIKNSAFAWEGINRRGQTIKGEMSGQNAAMVKAQLRKQGVNPLKVRKVAQPLLGMGGLGKKKIKSSDITFFTRQMATIIKAGVPLVQSFDIVADGIHSIGQDMINIGTTRAMQTVFKNRKSISLCQYHAALTVSLDSNQEPAEADPSSDAH